MAYLTFDEVFERFRYPAGESHLRLRPSVDPSSIRVIEAGARSFDDLGQILTADQTLRRLGAEVRWFVPYFPFARHDRRNHPGDGLELAVALQLVRPLSLVIADPHSEVAALLLHIPQASAVASFEAAGAFDDDPLVIVPDAGATRKVSSWVGARTVVRASKHRDPTTGELSGFEVHADDLGGRPCIIVDDICDGGGTFLGLAQALRQRNAGSLTLAVTHGLFTHGTASLHAAFARIFTFGPTGQPPVAGVTTIPYRALFERGALR